MSGGKATKLYLEGGYYHIYNRGNEKRLIFQKQQDYNVFLSYLKDYLLPKDEKELEQRLMDPHVSSRERDKIIKLLRLNNFADEITILAYCLMPNHFHFFIKQKSALSIDKFMNSLGTRYTKYFNTKYKRVGSLYQGVYKAVLVEDESQFIYLSKYIHQQALGTPGEAWEAKQPSSFPEYLGQRKTAWVYPEEILSCFSKSSPAIAYQNFIQEKEDADTINNYSFED